MSRSTTTSETKPQGEGARRPWRSVLVGGGVTVAVVGLVATVTHWPVASQSAEIQTAVTTSDGPRVGDTAGYNITNESGAILIYQGVGGHVAAPLPQGGAWIPGQTLNFELNTGTIGTDDNTGDALFEAYTATDPNNATDVGTVDIHFKQDSGNGNEGESDWAYLNPLDTAPLVASSTLTPETFDGETWTMGSYATNVIKSSTPQTSSVNSNWAWAGTSATAIVSSIQSAPGGQCSLQGVVMVCTLGGSTWQFGPNN